MRVSNRSAILAFGASALAGAGSLVGGTVAAIRDFPTAVLVVAWSALAGAVLVMAVMGLVVRRAVRDQKQKSRSSRVRRDLLRDVAQYERAGDVWLENN